MDYRHISAALAKTKNKGYERNAQFAVLIPLITINRSVHVIFEQRSFDLESQPGEICFPGGKMEVGEKPSETALRETMEELCLSSSQLKIIGSLPPLTTPFHFVIYPFCGVIQHTEYDAIRFSRKEVNTIFPVPLSHLLAQTPWEYTVQYDLNIEPDFPFHLIPNGKEYNWSGGHYQVLFYFHQEHVIWGLTAKMLHFFLESLREMPLSSCQED